MPGSKTALLNLEWAKIQQLKIDIDSVQKLHYKWEVGEVPFFRCHECNKPWPCPTTQILGRNK